MSRTMWDNDIVSHESPGDWATPVLDCETFFAPAEINQGKSDCIRQQKWHNTIVSHESLGDWATPILECGTFFL
jgi:hypothetical protein